MVIEYDDGVADMSLTLARRVQAPAAAPTAHQHRDQQGQRDRLSAGDQAGGAAGARAIRPTSGRRSTSYNQPARPPPASTATAWNAANAPYAVPSRAAGTRSATRALTVESCTPVAAPHSSTPPTASPTRSVNTSAGTAATTTGRSRSVPPPTRS